MNDFHLEIVTPTKVLDEGMVSYVRCPGLDGLFGVMAGHLDGLFALDMGEIKITQDHKDYYLATSGGFAEVSAERVELLLETVERSNEIDIERAEAAYKRAKERLVSKVDIDESRALASLKRAQVRLKVAKR